MPRPIPRSRWTDADYLAGIAHICYEGWRTAKGQTELNLIPRKATMDIQTYESDTKSLITALRAANTPECDYEAEMLAMRLDDLRFECHDESPMDSRNED
jgi:hypothetical protein